MTLLLNNLAIQSYITLADLRLQQERLYLESLGYCFKQGQTIIDIMEEHCIVAESIVGEENMRIFFSSLPWWQQCPKYRNKINL
jgi:hypothetical protein